MVQAISEVALATTNPGKIAECTAVLKQCGIQVHTPPQSAVVEDGKTFIENALIKARALAQQVAMPVLADDSGLCVQALQLAPGIYSARYAGTNASDAENINKVLQQLQGVEDRVAFFHCALVIVWHADDPAPLIAQARWYGTIATEVSGVQGFGYDPIFIADDCEGQTAAQLSMQEKNSKSHRGKALKQLAKLIQQTSVS